MIQPPRFEQGITPVCKFQKSLYGLKQSPRAWFHKFSKEVKKSGYIQSQANHTMFIKHTGNGKVTILIVYVDDIIVTCDDMAEIKNIKRWLATEFEVKDLGMMKYFLGMEIAPSRQGISVSQRKYTLDLLKKTGILNCKVNSTPVELGNTDRMFK
ncbi:transmembrane signal receptor [Lithospermum erythrorhizon]|uniref:Transmembrane signal receptor n=1 Tax=Lithospermum erythrorhizon TaxID=34254 RepID=A0AAV3RWH4_LITER